MKFKIDDIEIKNQVVLAPMAGISNPSYIKICDEMGLGYAVTELISAEAIVRNNKKTFDMLNGIEELNIPVAVQLFGSSAETIARAASILISHLPQIQLIDINMGCPVPKVAIKSQAGSALLKDPDKVKDIVASVVKAVPIPVTVKIRSGWDSNSINAPTIAKICEEAGAKAITIHARTRSQGYSGKADWNIIKLVKESVFIPVIGNGDVVSKEEAKRMLDETGCDAVMIGRGVLGNPWLIRECVEYLENKESKPILIKDVKNMMIKHATYLLQFKEEKVAILEMRGQACWYLNKIPNSKSLKSKFMQVKTKEEFINLVEGIDEE